MIGNVPCVEHSACDSLSQLYDVQLFSDLGKHEARQRLMLPTHCRPLFCFIATVSMHKQLKWSRCFSQQFTNKFSVASIIATLIFWKRLLFSFKIKTVSRSWYIPQHWDISFPFHHNKIKIFTVYQRHCRVCGNSNYSPLLSGSFKMFCSSVPLPVITNLSYIGL